MQVSVFKRLVSSEAAYSAECATHKAYHIAALFECCVLFDLSSIAVYLAVWKAQVHMADLHAVSWLCTALQVMLILKQLSGFDCT